MIKALVVDDEPLSISNLCFVLNKIAPDIDVIYTTTSATDALTKIEELKPDLLFLDIEMPFYNGLQLYDKIEGKKPLVVFITAFEQYAIDAFKVNAVNYILKPLDIDLIGETIDRVRKRLQIQNNNDIEKIVLSAIQTVNNRLSIPTSEDVKYVKYEEIMYLTSSSSYTVFKISNQSKTIISSKSLGYYESILPDNFIRIHHQNIVNTHFIESYKKGRTGKVLLKNGDTLEVSERKKNDLLDYMG